MAAPASPSRRPRSRHHHHHHNDHGSPAPTPSTPTSPKSPTSSRQTSRDRTLQSPTRPSSTSRQHTRSSSQNHSRRSASRDGDLHQRPITYRRHTTQLVPVTSTRTRPLPPIPHESHEDKHEKSSRSRSKRSHSTPAPIQKDGHILIPVPIRAHDAQTPLYVRAPPGQSVDFVFSPPKKKNLLERLLSNIEWEDKTPFADKPYRYQRPSTPDTSRPFYKRLLS